MATWIVISFIVGFLVGIIIGKLSSNYKPNGSIILGKNEDGDDRIVFQLSMEYDEIKDHDVVIFQVKKEN